jgi:hypothetical protein
LRTTVRRFSALPFSEPISCGFFTGAQKHPDARAPASRFHTHFLQPVRVQHDPLGEGRNRAFIRRFVGRSASKALAVPVDQPVHSMDLATGLLGGIPSLDQSSVFLVNQTVSSASSIERLWLSLARGAGFWRARGTLVGTELADSLNPRMEVRFQSHLIERTLQPA